MMPLTYLISLHITHFLYIHFIINIHTSSIICACAGEPELFHKHISTVKDISQLKSLIKFCSTFYQCYLSITFPTPRCRGQGQTVCY